MAHLQCRQLHSSVRQHIGQHLLHQPRSAPLTHSCQMRSAAHLTTGTKKGETMEIIQNYLSEFDHSFLQQQKSASKKRIPVHITSSINNQVDSTILLSLHSHLTSGDTAKAWKLFDKSTLSLSQQPIPRATANILLKSLHSDIRVNYPRLSLNFGKLEELYTIRLEKLVGLVKKNYLWDTREFCMLIELYGRLNQVKRAESMLRNIPHYCETPSVEIYNELIAVYVRRFRLENDSVKKRYSSKMETLLQEMTRKGLEPNATSYNLLLAAKIKLQDLRGAERLCAKMTVPPNRMTFNILLNGFLKGGRTLMDKQIVDEWMERMIASGITPNLKTFKSVIDGLAEQVKYHARMDEREEMEAVVVSISDLHTMAVQLGNNMDTEMINTLLKCYTAANDISNIEKIVGMLALPEKKSGCGNCGCSKSNQTQEQEVSRKQISPDTYTFNILIKYYLSNKNTDQAFQMYDTMVTMELEPDTTTYGNFISYYTERGEVKEGLRYFEVMQKKGIPTNSYIYNILLSSSIKYAEHAHLITPCLNSMFASGTAMDSVSRNILLSKQTSKESLDTSFENLLDSLDQNLFAVNDNGISSTGNTRTYNTLLQTTGRFYKANRGNFIQSLNSIMSNLDTSNIRPDLMTFALGIRNASYQGNMERAESIYKSMIDSGIKPNTYIFSHLIYGYSHIGKLDKAQDILKNMPSHNIIPKAINYAPLIKAYVESAEYQKAHSLFREMLSKNVAADLVVYTILAEAFLKHPSQESAKTAIDLLEGVEKAGISMDAASLTLLANAYSIDAASKIESAKISMEQEHNLTKSLENHTAKINTIYNLLKEKDWLDSQAVFVLLSAHVRMKNLGAAWAVWNDSLPKRLLHRPHYDALITGLSKDKTWYPIAKLTFEDMTREERLWPGTYTFDTMIWSAYSMGDGEMVKNLWCSPFRKDFESNKPFSLLVRTYYAVVDTMLKSNMLDIAKSAFEEYQTIPSPPDSSTIWNNRIGYLASRLEFKKDVTQ